MSDINDIRKQLLVARLPALPQILVKLLEYCQSNDVGLDKLTALVAKDPAITSKILRKASSSAYRRNGQPVPLDRALMTLGTDMIRTLVISESIFQTFNRFSPVGSTDLRRFWQHSLTASVLARDLSKAMSYPNPDEAYLGGLLHDVGRLAFLSVAPNKYAPTFFRPDDDDLCVTEQDSLHITHQEAGAWLIERWNLDPALADSVLYHHEPPSRVASAHPLVRIVLVAHLLSVHGLDEDVLMQSCELCNLSPDTVENICGNTKEKVGQSADFLGIDLQGLEEIQMPAPIIAEPLIQQQMSDELHNIVLASEAGRNFALQTDRSALFETILQTACILFNLDNTMMLETSADGRALVPAGKWQQQLPQFSIPLADGGLTAKAAQSHTPVFTNRDKPLLDIAEAQLLRALEAESLVCLPIVSGAACRHVLVGGAPTVHMALLEQNPRFMQSFASQAATAMQALDNRQHNELHSNVARMEDFKLSSRKMAHEVNNPLAIIRNYLSLLNDKLMKQQPIGREISLLNQEIDRVARILRKFSEPQSAAEPSPNLNVNAIIHDVAQIFRDAGFSSLSMQIIARTHGQPGNALCDPDALKQVLVNLVKNAVEAMPRGGQVLIANNGHTLHDGKRYLKLDISDSGPGMPPEVMENLFKPVHSTKGKQHSGLGLSIVHDLIHASGGQVNCHTSNEGTLFEIYLPIKGTTGQRKLGAT